MHVLNHFDSLCPHYVPVEFRCRLDIQDKDGQFIIHEYLERSFNEGPNDVKTA